MKTLTGQQKVLVATLVMFGAGSETAWAGINEWSSIGPDGGSIQALAIDPQNPSTVYASTLLNVYRSTDGAASWAKTGFTGHANNLVIDPRNSDTIYAPTPTGVSKSTDGGATWSAASSGLPGGPILLLIIDPQNSSTLYALTVFAGPQLPPAAPMMFAPTVFKTTDGGITWNPASSGLAPGNYALTLAIDPRNPSTLYAGTSSLPFPGNAGPGLLFRSTDGGASWSVADAGIPDCCVSALAIDPQDSKIIYAAWWKTAGVGWIVRSTDGGTTWTDVASDDLPGVFVRTLVIDPQNPATLYALTLTGFFKSTNGGTNWNTANLAGQVQTFAIDPQNPATVYAAASGSGVFKTTDGGGSWNAASSGIKEIPVRNLAIDPQHSGTLYAANGGKVLKTTDAGAHWIAGTLDAWKVAIDPQDPSTVFALVNDEFSGQPAKSTDGGASWGLLNLPLDSNDFVTDLAIDPQNSGVVYAGTAGGGVFKSADGGESWSLANSGLPQDYVGVLAISGGEATTVYASTADCDDSGCLGDGIFKSTDGGSSWTAANSGLPGGAVASIAIDPQNPGTLYIGLSWGENINRTGVFKSIDGGTSWKQLSPGLPEGTYFGPLAIDPRDSSTVYLGTGRGLFRSTDGGENWSAVNSGLPGISGSSLAIDPQDPNSVYAGTEAGLFVITFVP
jgi:photosystem II stability/assembly factor-like uncharacterized protein